MTAPRTARSVLEDLAAHVETWCHGADGPRLGADECQRLQREAFAVVDAPATVETVLEDARALCEAYLATAPKPEEVAPDA